MSHLVKHVAGHLHDSHHLFSLSLDLRTSSGKLSFIKDTKSRCQSSFIGRDAEVSNLLPEFAYLVVQKCDFSSITVSNRPMRSFIARSPLTQFEVEWSGAAIVLSI
jgi:hypothetical protein